MILGRYDKQPSEQESYTLNYEDALADGDYLQANAAMLKSVEPVGLVIDRIATFTPRVRFFASGGTDGTKYKASFVTTSADGRVFEDEVYITVKEL